MVTLYHWPSNILFVRMQYAVFSEFRNSFFFFIYLQMPLWLYDIQEPGLTGKYNF